MKLPMLIIALLLTTQARAQVSNNDIQHLQHLSLDSTSLVSTTRGSDVQWSCVSKSLTEKCLVYHNDLWFTFKVKTSGRYFLNISKQVCRDINKGMQLLLIEGSPCVTSSYKIKKCISKIRQEDLYLELDTVKANVEYLLNIDGFLGDYCEFAIQLSSHPKGFELYTKPLDTVALTINQKQHVVQLQWNVNELWADSISAFEIWRKEKYDKKATQLYSQALNRNTYGLLLSDYTYTDTLMKGGKYTYQVIGVDYNGTQKYDLAQKTISFEEGIREKARIELPLHYAEGTPVEFIFYDPVLSLQLKTLAIIVDKNKMITLSLSDYAVINTRRIDIVEKNSRTSRKVVHHVYVSPDGEVSKVH